MSAAPEMISRLAGGSTWKTERVDRVIPELGRDDLAGALAGLREGPAELMLVKSAGHHVGRLHALVYTEAAAMSRRYRWAQEPALTRRMVRLAVFEVVGPEAYTQTLTRDDRELILRLDHSGDSPRYIPVGPIELERYDRIYALVQGWESEGIGHLTRRLFG